MTHSIVSFAHALDEGAQRAFAALKPQDLPNLHALLARDPAPTRDDGDEWSMTPPHERVHAKLLGLWAGDGRVPWAALAQGAAAADSGGWAQVTPCHWSAQADRILMLDPQSLDLSDAESRALCASVEAWFAQDGLQLIYDRADRWWLRGDALASLRCASLDRVIGRNVLTHWQSQADEAAIAKTLRRLHNEVQMLWHQHPVNDARRVPVNALWFSGAGALPAGYVKPDIEIRCIDDLRRPALANDWTAWADAWRAVDQQLVGAHTVSLCGERAALCFRCDAPQSLWQRLQHQIWKKNANTSAISLLSLL